jgi:hypothetical protein
MVLSNVVKSYAKSYYARTARCWFEWRLSRQPPQFSLDRRHWDQSLQDPTGFYAECTRFFFQGLPPAYRDHRAYFYNVPNNRRGFGENAFHTMWYLLLQELKPRNFLEIGVFRGQVISLVALWARLSGQQCDVWGISPFTGAGDSTSKYRRDLDYQSDTLRNFEHFNLPRPNLVRASSLDPEAVHLIGSKTWDLVYIDGNHDYEVANQDWELCSRNVKPGGIIVLDDAGLFTAYAPRIFSTAGIEGPSRLAREIDRSRFREVLQVGHNRAFQRIA